MITARELFLALEEKKNDFKPDRWAIITEIVNAREQIEIFDMGGFGKQCLSCGVKYLLMRTRC